MSAVVGRPLPIEGSRFDEEGPRLDSHLQTRTLTDALRSLDAVLAARGTQLRSAAARDQLDALFSRAPCPAHFAGWAFDAAEFDRAVATVAAISPALAAQMRRPVDPLELAIVGHCSMDLRFAADVNGTKAVAIELADGRRLDAASVQSRQTLWYESGLVGVPARTGETVYFYRPAPGIALPAGVLAHQVFSARGGVRAVGATLCFLRARTSRLADCAWVSALETVCGLYTVRQFLNDSAAVVDESGFFARETVLLDVVRFCEMPPLPKVILDGPFLVFCADASGLQAAAWFSWDAFFEVAHARAPEVDWSEEDIGRLFDD